MAWLKSLFGGGTKKMREAALKMGFKVEEVDRDIPIFARRNHFDSLSRGRCVKYSLTRRPNAGTGWTLLQRDKAHGSQLPNGYLATATSLTPQLIEKLRPLAIEFNEEFFEFEASDFEVSVYWEEWGGEAQVARLHKALSVI